MNKVRILTIYMEEILKHSKDETWNSKYLSKGTDTELFGDGDEESNSQHSEKYPPFFAPGRHRNSHEDRNTCQKYDQYRAGNQCLLYSFVDEIDVPMKKGFRDFG